MKSFASIIGIVLLVCGGYFIYDGIQSKQTFTSKVKKELSSAFKNLSNDSRNLKTKIKNNPDLKIIGGSIVLVCGVVLVIKGFKK
jgi:putative Mn2+ efflux pump MntP